MKLALLNRPHTHTDKHSLSLPYALTHTRQAKSELVEKLLPMLQKLSGNCWADWAWESDFIKPTLSLLTEYAYKYKHMPGVQVCRMYILTLCQTYQRTLPVSLSQSGMCLTYERATRICQVCRCVVCTHVHCVTQTKELYMSPSRKESFEWKNSHMSRRTLWE